MDQEVPVEIFGQVYTVRGELEAAYVKELAQYVDEKMRAIAEATSMVDSQKIAVLAALTIADELKTLRTDTGDFREELKSHAERCLSLVERALNSTE